MRGVVLCLVAAIGLNAIAASEPAGVSMTAANQSYKSGAAAHQPYEPAIASVLPTRGQVVGVAHPVVVTFSEPVSDRRAAERAIAIKSVPAMTGKFDWLDNELVQWIPDRRWPAHSTVAHSAGGFKTELATGPAGVAVANSSDPAFALTIDCVDAGPRTSLPPPHHRPHWGEPGVSPAPIGRPEYPTPVGTYTLLSKERDVV